MIMNFEKFKELIEYLEKSDSIEDKLYSYLHIDTIWDSHNKAISLLLEQIFPKTIVDYIIFPHVYEHDKTDITIDDKKYSCKNVEELYKIVCLLGEKND